MRISYRFGRTVVIAGRPYRARIRVLRDENELRQQPYGVQGGETLRLLLPYGADVHARDMLYLDGKAFVCCATRAYPGHTQADFKRIAL